MHVFTIAVAINYSRCDWSAVIEGMSVVKAVEAKGSSSGKPAALIKIVESGEL